MFRTVDLKTNPRLDCKKLEPGNGTLNLDSIFGEAIAQPGLSSILEKDKRESEPEIGFVQSVNYPSRNFDDETELQVEDGSVMELTFEAFDLEPDSTWDISSDLYCLSCLDI